ncbi:hypothetical protein N665_0460s0017 [Sinapis alba]|nr:hypothetical protein N665_0460s0017 [Sinapis alba]
MRKSLQLLSTFLTMFIILSLEMMAEAQPRRIKFCTYDVPVDSGKSCDTKCVYFCKRLFGPIGKSVCEKVLKGYCQCSAVCKGSR